MSNPKAYFPHIDGLRMLAVIGVLLAHFSIPGFEGGFLGVDVFFVISGFLISRLIIEEKGRTGRFRYSRFYVRRIRRLLPAALAVVAISLILFYPILDGKELRSFLRSIPFSIFSLANVNYYLEVGYFDTSAQFKPLLHTWSLAVEEQFYFIWPTILLVLLNLKRWLLLASLACLAISLAGAIIVRPEHFSAAYYLLPFRAFELLIGATLATLMASYSPDYRDIQALPKGARVGLAWLGLAMILVSFGWFDEASPLPGLASLVPCLGTALIIAYGAEGGVGRFLTWRPIIWIGLISYSLYLVHWPVWVYISYRLPWEPSLAMKLAMFPTSILLAAASYYLVEQPFRHPREGKNANVPFIGAIGIVACLLVIPTVVYKFSPDKLPISITNYRREYGGPSNNTFVPFPDTAGPYVIERWSGGDQKPRILILGDSHAGHLRGGVREVLAPLGYNVDLARVSGCPPLIGITIQRETDSGPDKSCSEANGALQTLISNDAYDVVIVTSRWGLAVGERDLPSRRLRHIDYVEIEGEEADLSIEQTRHLFGLHLKQTIDSLLGSGKTVILLSQVPPPGTNLHQCAALFPGTAARIEADSRCATMTGNEVAMRMAFSNQIFESYADMPKMLYIDSSELMCSETTCLTYTPKTDELIFNDDNHLNEIGSAYYLDAIVKHTKFLEFIH